MFIDGWSAGLFTFIKVSVTFQSSEQTFAQWAAHSLAFLSITKKKVSVAFPQILLSHLTEAKYLYHVFNLICYYFIDRHQFLNWEVFMFQCFKPVSPVHTAYYIIKQLHCDCMLGRKMSKIPNPFAFTKIARDL